jgi:predicted nucleic acid-binding Zn ribbon protein
MKKDKGNQTGHIGEAIRDMLDTYRLTSRFDEATVIANWERLMGKPIARHTAKLYFRDKVLFVHLDSPGLRHDLSFSKPKMLEILEAEYGKGVVREIVLM